MRWRVQGLLACAQHFAEPGFSTFVVESYNTLGAGSSERSSEVFHAGSITSKTQRNRGCVLRQEFAK